ALLPIFLYIATGPLGINPRAAGLGLGFTLGIMGILTPYATGPAPVYYSCGYIRKRDFWWFGLVMGTLFLAAYLTIGLPWLMSRPRPSADKGPSASLAPSVARST